MRRLGVLAMLLLAAPGAAQTPLAPGPPPADTLKPAEAATALPVPAVEFVQVVLFQGTQVAAICSFAVLADSTTVWIPFPDPRLAPAGDCAPHYHSWVRRRLGGR